jgi:tetratricopeptide (TPR) repeat protein
MPGHDRIRFIDPASYESPSAFEGLTSLLTTLNTFEQQKKAEERQDEADKENQRRYEQENLYRAERDQIEDQRATEQNRYKMASDILTRAKENNPNNPFGVYLEVSTTDLFLDNPSLMRQFGIDEFKKQGESYNELQNILTGLGDVSDATISEIQDLQGNERVQGLIKDAGSYGQVFTQQLQNLKKDRRTLETSQVETNPEYMALVKSLENETLTSEGLQSENAQAILSQINNKKLELQNFYSQQGTAATTEQFIPFENLTEAQQKVIRAANPNIGIFGTGGTIPIRGETLADEFEYQGFVQPTTRLTPAVSEIEAAITDGNLEDVLDGDTTPKRGRVGFTDEELREIESKKKAIDVATSEVNQKVSSLTQELINLENEIKGSNDENQIRILKEELSDVTRELAMESSKLVPIKASQALNATNKFIKEVGFAGRLATDALLKELFVTKGENFGERYLRGFGYDFSKFPPQPITEKPTEVETPEVSSVNFDPDTTYFTDLEKQIADAKDAPPPIIEENPREDTTTATEVNRNVGPPRPFQIFDSVFNENNKSYTLGLSSRSKNKDGGVGLSMYNLYETSNGVTKDLGPAVQTVGTGKRLTAKQPYKTKNKKNARIILELIKG